MSSFGICLQCGSDIISRSRLPRGVDVCVKGHSQERAITDNPTIRNHIQSLTAQLAAIQQENEALRAALESAATIVNAQCEAEHMLDGFGGRQARPSDAIKEQVSAALAQQGGK